MSVENFQQLGRYVLVKKIAQGGMADVYRAKLPGAAGFEKDVAIKKILPHWSGNQEFIDMLIDEARVLLHLNHSNIVQINEFNREGDTYFIVMEYVSGFDMRAVMNRLQEQNRGLPLALACYIAREIATGLQYAHEKRDRLGRALGIVHRDISPQNILLSLEGEVKVTDFGIAKAVGKNTETVAGTLKGKFAYMSPEQAVGKDIDLRTDLFALGILLYEMGTGLRCFAGRNDLETLEAVKNAEVTFTPKHLGRIPGSFRAFVLKALAKRPEDRFQTASEMKAALKILEEELGYIARASDLKAVLFELFPSSFLNDALSGEEALQDALKTGSPSFVPVRKTKVLVARPRLPLAGTVVEAATFVLEKTRMAFEALPQTLMDTFRGRLFQQRSRRQRQAIGGVFAFLVCVSVWAGYDLTRIESPPPVLNSVIERAPEAISFPPNPELIEAVQPALSEQEKVGEKVELKKEAFGSLEIKARPWGTVVVPGLVQGVETPVTRHKIPVGQYTVKVLFPPSGKTLSAQARVAENSSTTCKALFGENARIDCY